VVALAAHRAVAFVVEAAALAAAEQAENFKLIKRGPGHVFCEKNNKKLVVFIQKNS